MPSTIYDKMKFPPYEYREYPKAVYPEGGELYGDAAQPHMRGKPIPVLVHSEDEELAVMTASSPREAVGSAVDSLRAQAERLGVTVDRRWGVARLASEIDKADARRLVADA